MQTVTHHGRETAYRHPELGTGGPTVLFVHGSGGTHELWVGQYGRRENDSRGVALDLSGHGDSADVDTPAGPATLAAYVEDVEAVARETDASVLVGNSLGGAVVLQALLEGALDPAGVVLAGTGAKLTVHRNIRDLLASDFESAIDLAHGPDLLFHDPTDDQVERSKATLRDTGRRVTERDFLTCHEFDVRDRLADITVPALALVGEHDSMTPPDYHEYLAAEMPHCEYGEIADAAHLAMVERPEAFAAAVDAFVADR